MPEPVAWEWAEHLAKQWAAARTAFRDAARLWKAGLLPVLQFEKHYKDEAAVIEAFLARLKETPHVEVIPLTPESAIEGLKDQILRRRPAKPKSEVKTGGSDSAWLRTVLAKVDQAADTLLFLSSDGDIQQAYEQWGHEPPLLRTPRDIRDSLFETLPTSAEHAWLIAEYLAGPDADRSPDARIDEFSHQILLEWLAYRRTRWPNTANPHLLINQMSAHSTRPVSTIDFAKKKLRGQTATLERLRVDRQLEEALTTAPTRSTSPPSSASTPRPPSATPRTPASSSPPRPRTRTRPVEPNPRVQHPHRA